MTQLPKGFGYAWTGQSLQEKEAGSQATLLFALSIVVVFLCLAALYESWSIPFSVMLVIPLGVIGSVVAVMLRGMPNDVYFKIGLITIIGLSAKNAILIIEFAKDLWRPGTRLVDATVEASRLRFRPIVMTSLAFIFGVVPLAIATGAASKRPAGDRHRRDGRHDLRDGAGGDAGAGVLRGGDAAVPAPPGAGGGRAAAGTRPGPGAGASARSLSERSGPCGARSR